MDHTTGTRFRSKPLCRESKRLVHNVIKFCDREALEGNVIVPLSQSVKRTSKITCLSEATIKRIRRESKGEDTPKFVAPKKRLKKSTIENIALDNFDSNLIRRTIHEFYAVSKIVPTISKLIPVLQKKINFQYQRETLRRILHEIGFLFKKTQTKRRQLVERSDIVLARTQFLRNMKRYRAEKRPIVYLKSRQSDIMFGIVKTDNESRQIVVLCAGGEMGFIPKSKLVYETNLATGDYQGPMTSEIFEKWAEEKLIPNLPQNAVVVLDNAPYHSIQLNKVPNLSNEKVEIMEWLSTYNIPYSNELRKIELLDIVKRNQPTTKLYKFDCMLQERGFQTLRLPPYHCDINAIEYVWEEVKNYIRNHNVTGDIVVSKLLMISKEAIENVTMEHWKKYCSIVAKLENTYWESDGIIEDLCEPLLMDESETDDDSDVSSDEFLQEH